MASKAWDFVLFPIVIFFNICYCDWFCLFSIEMPKSSLILAEFLVSVTSHGNEFFHLIMCGLTRISLSHFHWSSLHSFEGPLLGGRGNRNSWLPHVLTIHTFLYCCHIFPSLFQGEQSQSLIPHVFHTFVCSQHFSEPSRRWQPVVNTELQMKLCHWPSLGH